jgi:DNA-binding Xre family transcriptional regulator
MITNDRQHRITNSQAKRFEAAIFRTERDGPTPEVDARVHTAMIDGMRSQLEDLRNELSEYDALRAGEVKGRVFHSLLQIPQALIEGRIARRFTQKALGDKLGVPEQQIQRYERTRYSGVGVERLQQIADVLGIKVEKTVEYHVAESRSREGGGRTSSQSATRSTRRKGTVTPITTKGKPTMAGSRKTGKAAASAAGKTLTSKTASTAAKKAAASDLAQVGNRKVTGKKAASSAGKTLASKSASKTSKKAAASDLSQAGKKKR